MTRPLLAVFSLFTLNAQTIAPDGFRGSVTNGEVSPAPLKLSLEDAIERGLKANIGLLIRSSDFSEARAERLRALSALLPKVTGGVTQYVAQNNLTTFGIHVPGFPPVVGPFSYFDARAFASSPIFDWALMKRVKAATETARA